MLFNLPPGVLLIRGQLAITSCDACVWRNAVLYALLLAVGTFGCYGAYAILALRKP
jgi:hypothetical protein